MHQVNEPDQNTAVAREIAPKKAYEKPQIVYRAPLEAMAAVCTPQPPGKADLSCGTVNS